MPQSAPQTVPKRRLLRVTLVVTLGLLAVLAAGAARRQLFRARDPEQVWREAEANTLAGRLALADQGLRLLQLLRTPTPEDWILRAQVSAGFGRDALALEAISHVPADHPLAAQAWFMAGRIEREKGRLRFAEAAFRRAIALEPGLARAHKELVYLYGVQLRRSEVDAEFRVLSRLVPLAHHDLFTWCFTHFSGWAPDIANDLEAFIKADPLDRYSRLALASLLVDAPGMEDRVLRVLEPLPRTDPEASALRIELELNQGNVDQAEALLQSSPAHGPRLARLRGRMSLTRGDLKAAIVHFQNALRAEPYDRASLHDLGKALVVAGEKQAAERFLVQAKRLDDVYNLINRVRRPDAENEAADLTSLARTCEVAGLLFEARGWYLLAIKRDPLDTAAQQALWRLRDVALNPRNHQMDGRVNVSLGELDAGSQPPEGRK